MRDLLERYLEENEIDDFSMWAFGPDYMNLIGLINFMEKWNERHDNLLTLEETSSPVIDIQKMIDLWRVAGEEFS